MTSPDGQIPGGAANYDSLAEFAAKTEEDWRAEMSGRANQTWGEPGLLGGLFQNLSRGKPLVQSVMESLADAIGLDDLWDNVVHVSQGIGAFIKKIFGIADSADSTASAALEQATRLRTVGAWHADRSDDVSFAFGLIDGSAAPAAGKAVLIPITVHKDRPVEAIKFCLDGAPTMTNCYVAVFTVDRASGAATRWIDVGDVRTQLNNPESLKVVPLPSPVTMAKEELCYLWIGQTGTATKLASWSSTYNVNTGLIPRTIGLQTDGTAPPASFTDAQVQTGTTKFWGAIGAVTETGGSTPPADRFTYSDQFSRGDTDTLGGLWMTRSVNGSLQVRNAEAYAQSWVLPPFVRFTSNSYISRLGGTEQQLSWTVPVQAPNSSVNQPLTAVMCRGDGSGRAVMFTANAEYEGVLHQQVRFSIGIWQSTDFGVTRVNRFSADVTGWPGVENLVFRGTATGNTYVLEVQRIDGYWYSQNWQWVDLNNLFPIGRGSNTEVGVGGQGKAVLDNWQAKDL